jgi:anaerobic magnesium-protoporphyrin IX monomethyl ester cyclase
MKILITNPAFRRDLGGGLERYMLGAGMRFPWSLLKRREDRPRYAMFPLFLAYAAALLERDGFDVKVLDAVPLNVSEEELLRRIAEIGPDAIVIEPNAAVIADTLALLGKVRAVSGARTVLVGTHATVRAAELLGESACLDYVVRGEYEQALLGLMRALREEAAPAGVAGVTYRSADGAPVDQGRTAPIAPLDELPLPARHLFPAWFDTDMSAYNDGFCQNSPAFHIHTSRGCPYQCNFCDRIQVLFGDNKQRFFSPARVVDEMRSLAAAGAKEIYIDDDNFTGRPAHVAALCEELIRRPPGVPWSAMCDVMSLNVPLLEKMARAGCIGLKFGLDSADARVLSAIKKPLKLPALEAIVARARALGMKTHMSVVLGLSGETRETLHKTFAYACEVDIDSIQFSLATPLPGTTYYQDLETSGALASRDWAELDGANRTVISYPDMSREYLEAFMSRAHSDWLRAKFRKPRWLLRQTRFLARTAKSQGLPGLGRRMTRAWMLLSGDAVTVREAGEVKVLRY